MYKVPLEFEGQVPLPAHFAPHYDCRICMVQHDGREYHILPGEMVICLPDHHYAHADHSLAEKLVYKEMLEARLLVSECQRLDMASLLR
jgi:hypothetical protein